MYKIAELGKLFGLSRSTLLYYDRIGLLSPSARSGKGYRLYSEADRERLEAICTFRQAGLGMEDIAKLLGEECDDTSSVLRRRLRSLEDEARAMRGKQRLLAEMLHVKAAGWGPAALDKELLVGLLRSAGMDDEAMDQWHREFERRAPKAHQEFLRSLGIDDAESAQIRERARLEGK